MQEYNVEISERLQMVIPIQAETLDDAMDKVRAMYRKSEVILTADNHVETAFSVLGAEPDENAESLAAAKCICCCSEKSATVNIKSIVRSDGKAYKKLTALLFALEKLLDGRFDANSWVDELNHIVFGVRQ